MSVFLEPKLKEEEIPNLKGKKVIVVGGTHGMGAEVAKMCKDLGAKVIVFGRTKNPSLDVPQVSLDVMKENISPYFSGVDYVFNNVGKYYKGTIQETDVQQFQDILDHNLVITYYLTRQAMKGMNKGGVLVNMASRPTLANYHSWSAYTLAKQGVITLTKSAAEEGDVKAYSVCPSRVDTKFRDEVFPDEDKNTRLSPKEVAELVVKLFNGKNPNGEHYWIKKLYKGSK